MTTSATSSTHRSVVPSEVGWQFVPQYYTFVNKQPDRLHCFYTKKSIFIHGTEGEDVKPCHGQHEIHEKITSIGFEDCKVFIHSVDAQSSADGGIIIQVIGEMSNHGDPWRKFVQTFFLAEQPNGYFVLNDIFRFLKEETVDSDEASELADQEPAQAPAALALEPAPSPSPSPSPAPVVEVPREPTPPPPAPAPVASPAPPPAYVEEPPAPVVEVPEPPAQVPTPAPEPPRQNGIHPVTEPVVPAAPSPAPPAPASPAPEKKPATPAPVASPAPAPTPPQPKTWANLAAANPKKWGAAVAQDSKGTTEVVPSSSTPVNGVQTPTTAAPSPSGHPARPPHPGYVAAQAITTPHCFVKGVTENVPQATLEQVLTQRFGPLKDIDVVRSKACAFAEFASLESAKRAIIASLPPSAGGEGGIWINLERDGQARISVETRKERGDRPAPRPRGGAPGADGGRGGSLGSRGGPGRGGRGGRGGK